MARVTAVVFQPPTWINQPLVLYHGTVDLYSAAIGSGGVDIGKGKPRADFGPGFYTTTVERQAQTWAKQLEATMNSDPRISLPVTAKVVEFVVPRDRLSQLETLGFVRGDFDADDFWSFVHHCRQGALNHRLNISSNYDVVFGPVTAFWNQQMIVQNADQISFHTERGQDLLNGTETSRRVL